MRALSLLAALAALALASCGGDEEPNTGQGVLHFTVPRLNGEPDDLSRYRGKVVLVVNTASECGFTPQFAGLERLYDARRRDGFVILGFPQTTSPVRSRARTTRSPSSAGRTSACRSRCSPSSA